MNHSKHILIIRLSAMGDVAMTIPVVHAFAKAHPETKITFLSKPFLRPIVETLPNVHFVAAKTNGRHQGIVGLWRLSRELKKLNITHIADIHNVLRSRILCAFLNLPSAKIDKGRPEKKALARARDKQLMQLKTTVQRYVDVFTTLGLEGIEPEAISKPESTEAVRKFTSSDTKKWLGIAPFAAHVGKQYPLDLMRGVILQLDKKENVRLFLFGAPSEEEELQKLCQETNNTQVVAGELTFAHEINLIGQLDGMLAMDSGNGHIAAMFGVPTVTLWGVTHPYAGFAPFEQEQNSILPDRKQFPLIPTSIYGNKVPEGYEDVMRTISPEEAVRKLELVL